LLTNTGNIQAGNVYALGNITSGSYILGNGAFLSGLPAQYSNANVANYLPLYTGNLVSLTGNVITTANVSANYVFGNGALLTGITTNYSNANVEAYLPTYYGNLGNLQGNVVTGANVQGVYILGNGYYLTGLVTQDQLYSNSNVANYLPTYTGNLASLTGNVTTTANVQASYLLGNITRATGYYVYGNANVANYLPAFTGNISAGNVSITGNVSASYVFGNITLATGYSDLANAIANVTALEYSNSNVANYLASNSNITILTTGNVTTQGNVQGNYIIGNGAFLTGVTSYTNANVSTYLAGNSNITILVGTGNITTQGNVSANYILANGAFLTGLPAGYANSNVANYLPVYTGNLASLTGNVVTSANVSGNYLLGNITQATGYYVYGNSNVANYLPTFTGNLTAGNANVTGNVQANYYLGNGYYLTGLVTQDQLYSNANVANYLPVYTGNVSAGNVSVTGNVTANYVLANITQATGYYVYGNANVANYLASNSNIVIVTTSDITTQGNISANSATFTGNITTTANVQGAWFVGNVNAQLLTVSSNATIVGNLSAGNISTTALTATGNVTGGNLTSQGNLTVVGSSLFGSNVIIQGNLQVVGNVTSLSYSVANIANLQIVVAANAATPSQANNAGLVVASGYASWLYNSLSNAWISTVGIYAPNANFATSVTSNTFYGNFSGPIIGNITAPGSNTDVLFNYNGNIGTSNNFTYNSLTNQLYVGGNVRAENNFVIGNSSQAFVVADIDSGNATYAGIRINRGTNNVEAWFFGSDSTTPQGNFVVRSNAATNIATFAPAENGLVAQSVFASDARITGNLTTTLDVTVGNALHATGALYLNSVQVTNNYTVSNTDYAILVNGTGNVNITLPNTATNGRTLDIKDISGQLSLNQIINIVGTVDGTANFQLNRPYNSATLIYNTSGWWIL
jgi:hypothetical protein